MNFPTLFKIIPEPFGLDLSDRSIKVAKLSRNKGVASPQGFSEEIVEEGLIEDGIIISEKKLSERIASAARKLKIGRSNYFAACSLPEQKSFLRVIQLPLIKKEEVQEAVRWEIEANIPLGINDLYYDWKIILPLHNKVTHFDVLISAAPRDLVDSYNRLLKYANVIPFSFEPESLALAKCLIKGDVSEKPTLIIDLGQTRTNLIIHAGQGVRLTSRISISGNVITDNIKRDLRIDVEEAERLKKKVGLDQEADKKVFEAIMPAVVDLRQQIAKYIDFYVSHESHIHNGKSGISGIILSGGGAHMKGLVGYLSSSIKIPVRIADPFVNMGGFKKDREKFVKYSTAIGLAL